MNIKLISLKKLKDQDEEVAKKLRPGQIVSLHSISSSHMTKVFYKESYLGSVQGVYLQKFAEIKNFEPLVRKTNFTFELLNISAEKAVELEEKYHQSQIKKKAQIQDEIIENRQRKIESNVVKDPLKEQTITEKELLNAFDFQQLAKQWNHHINAKKASISVFSWIFEKYSIDNPLYSQEWLKEKLKRLREFSSHNKYVNKMIELNERDQLQSLMKGYIASITSKHYSGIIKESGNRIKAKKYGRETHCWNCGSYISTNSHIKCQTCRWIICSCGACSKGCGGNRRIK